MKNPNWTVLHSIENPPSELWLWLRKGWAGFCIGWAQALVTYIPRGASDLTAWFGKELHPAAALSEWKNCVQWDCSYVRPFYTWGHWFISVCGLNLLCNYTACWVFTVKTLGTEKCIHIDTAQTLTLFLFLLNSECFGIFFPHLQSPTTTH